MRIYYIHVLTDDQGDWEDEAGDEDDHSLYEDLLTDDQCYTE